MTPADRQPHPQRFVVTFEDICIGCDMCNDHGNDECSILDGVRSRPHTSPPAPTDEQCRICSRATARKAREESQQRIDAAMDTPKDLKITAGLLYEFCEWFCDYDCEEKPCKVTVSQLHERLEGIKRQMETHPEYLAKWNEKRAEQRALLQAGRK